MSGKTYVIRAYCFGYNDECYYVCGSRINGIYHDKEAAEKKYKALEVDYVRNTDLGEEGSIFDSGKNFIKKLDDFVFKKTGVHIMDGDYIDGGTSLPSKMSDDEVLEFAKLAKIQAYKLVAFESKPVFYALWDPMEQQYQLEYDECYTGLVYSESKSGAMKNLDDFIEDRDWQGTRLKGTLQDLSATPELLEKLIESHPKKFGYNQSKSELIIKKAKATSFSALNELLKVPLFELRELTPETLLELEQELADEDYC